MEIIFSAISIICSYFSIEEYWNVVNIISACILLILYVTPIKKSNILYTIPLLVLIIKDTAWWIINVGSSFSKLAVEMAISGVSKMVFNIIIVVLAILIYRCRTRNIKSLVIMEAYSMLARIILFILPLIIYHNTFANLYIEYLSVGSYIFIFAGYMYVIIKDRLHFNKRQFH